ncbi:type II toxin-antitoxin system death-on-curing family toxin [Pararhizobium capsulatum]|uniref:type II toxin-antitoxin system death-on-curing family toxin n=1 Tax=Pararhizobium capsulatum TaxID=34014 RepID=UPI0027D8FB76|nr:type II toxin-antitoxin system death-on-curing family toxin [Pararhizobium capsulatum]
MPGLKDENALESALSRPINKHGYGEADIFVLAAAYLYGIVRNDPFSDGNKRTGFLAAYVFLLIHGQSLEIDQGTAILFVLGVAAGEITEDNAANFLRDHCVPRK